MESSFEQLDAFENNHEKNICTNCSEDHTGD